MLKTFTLGEVFLVSCLLHSAQHVLESSILSSHLSTWLPFDVIPTALRQYKSCPWQSLLGTACLMWLEDKTYIIIWLLKLIEPYNFEKERNTGQIRLYCRALHCANDKLKKPLLHHQYSMVWGPPTFDFYSPTLKKILVSGWFVMLEVGELLIAEKSVGMEFSRKNGVPGCSPVFWC